MDTKQHLILVKGENLTKDITSCETRPESKRVQVTFHNGKSYPYSPESVVWLRHPQELDPDQHRVYRGDQSLQNVTSIRVFEGKGLSYVHLSLNTGQELCLPFDHVKIVASCLVNEPTRNLLDYLRRVAAVISLKADDGTALLTKAYEKAGFISDETAFAAFSDPATYRLKSPGLPEPVFPFGVNASQLKAVERALTNQVSVIQGPPGTGKTQTILNILANLVLANKTVQVVANNNSATENVLEKLAKPEYNLGFLVASLGKAENKERFLENQSEEFPADFASWSLPEAERWDIRQRLADQVKTLRRVFQVQEELAQLRQTERDWKLEVSHFDALLLELGLANVNVRVRQQLASEVVMKLWHHARRSMAEGRPLAVWFRFRCRWLHGLGDKTFFQRRHDHIEALLQRLFYEVRGRELAGQIEGLEAETSEGGHTGILEFIQVESLRYVKAALYERWKEQPTRPRFDKRDLSRDSDRFLASYPIVLSSTFSSTNSLGPSTVFDYVIVDEASQVDLATGCLALTCARNAVVVGDTQQLPNVLPAPMKAALAELFTGTTLGPSVNAAENSFLQAVVNTLYEAPQTLLREHYRCHPKIANFFNQRFYGGKLIVLSADHGEEGVLSAYRTPPGHHERDRTNQRQIDVIGKEVLPSLPYEDAAVGIIAPYRNQTTALQASLAPRAIEASTVHKFQGREKEVIILTTVDNELTPFSDDPNLLNVAVSRARKQFTLVTSAETPRSGSPVGDLMGYIRYNNLAIVDSEVRSVFDLLYRHYAEARKVFLARHKRISEYDSENLMFALLEETLAEPGFDDLGVVCHQPLRWILRDLSKLSPEELDYATKPGTHVDFLVFSRVSKQPVLAVEVDGVKFHRAGTAQHRRDQKKDTILQKYGLRLLRLATNGSGEKQKLKAALSRSPAPQPGVSAGHYSNPTPTSES